MKLDYQRPQGGDVGSADPADVSGFIAIKFGPKEAIVAADVHRRNDKPAIYVSMVVQADDESWVFLLEDGYPRRINTKDQPISWFGFFYPTVNFKLVIETGRLGTTTWDTTQLRYHYQSVIVKGG